MWETKLFQPSNLSPIPCSGAVFFRLHSFCFVFGKIPRVSGVSLLPFSHREGAWAYEGTYCILMGGGGPAWIHMVFSGSSPCLLQGGFPGLLPGLVTTDVQLVLILGIWPGFAAEDYGSGSFWFISCLSWVRAQPLPLPPLPHALGPWVWLWGQDLGSLFHILWPHGHLALTTVIPLWYVYQQASNQHLCFTPPRGHTGDSEFLPHHTGTEGSLGN